MAKDTCRKEKCKLWKQFKGEGCPNFYRNTFYPGGKMEEVRVVDDCAPIRIMLMLQELHSRLIGVQKGFEEQRNVSVDFINLIMRELDKKRLQDGGKDKAFPLTQEVDIE
jgi:hypothetical protein